MIVAHRGAGEARRTSGGRSRHAAGRAPQEAAEGEDDGLAAFNTIRTMCTVLDSVSQQPALVAQLEDVCFPILQKMISQAGQDVFEEVSPSPPSPEAPLPPPRSLLPLRTTPPPHHRRT